MELNKDFREFIELLNVHNVRYLVVGGYAVNYYGYPRYTKDINLWIWLKKENLEKLLLTLSEFGFGSLNLTDEVLYDKNNIIQLGYEPYRIDLMMDVDGIDFDKCFADRKIGELEGIRINFLSLDDLITAKKLRDGCRI